MRARLESGRKKIKEFLLAISVICFLVFEINKKRFLGAANTIRHECA
jgi:hypothetical protein